MQRLPAMRQEVGDEMVFVRGQALQHIFHQCFGRGRAVGDLPALQFHPLVQCVSQWFGLGLSNV